jgi:hypothetical protein
MLDELGRMLVKVGDEEAAEGEADDWDDFKEELEDGMLNELDGVGAVSVTSIVIGGGLTSIIEYPVVVTVVALGEGVTKTVCVASGPSMVM